MFKNKKVLVTGGSGMIGRELVDMLKARGAIVRVADIKQAHNMHDVEFMHVDLRNFACG